MSYNVTTYFDNELWDKYGLNWLRQTKSLGLYGFVMFRNLKLEAENKIKELGFSAVPVKHNFGDDRDYILTIIDTLEHEKKCLFVKPEIVPTSGLSEDKELICREDKNLNIYELVNPINNLQQRTKAIKQIRDKLGEHYLSSKHVLASWEFWVKYSGFQNLLHDKKCLNYFDSDLTLNLYYSLVEPFPSEIQSHAAP